MELQGLKAKRGIKHTIWDRKRNADESVNHYHQLGTWCTLSGSHPCLLPLGPKLCPYQSPTHFQTAVTDLHYQSKGSDVKSAVSCGGHGPLLPELQN